MSPSPAQEASWAKRRASSDANRKSGKRAFAESVAKQGPKLAMWGNHRRPSYWGEDDDQISIDLRNALEEEFGPQDETMRVEDMSWHND